MLAQFVGVVFCLICFCCAGGLTKKLVGWQISYVTDFFVGLALTNGLLTIVSIVHPVNNTVFGVYLVTVLTAAWLNRKWLIKYADSLFNTIRSFASENPLSVALLTAFLGISFFQSIYQPSLHYDAALYHIPSIQWTTQYPTVRGLAHLNIFFAHTFNIYPLYAAFSFSSWFGQPLYVINFTVLCVFSSWLTSLITTYYKQKNYVACLAFLSSLYYLYTLYWMHISTTSNDGLLYELILFLVVSGATMGATDMRFAIPLLAAYCFTVKLSSGPVLIMAVYFLSNRQFWAGGRKTVFTIASTGLIVVPWLVKNTLVSGWPLFPLPYFSPAWANWRISRDEIIAIKQVVTNYYLPTGYTIEGNWMIAWLKTQHPYDVLMILLVSLFFLYALASLFRRGDRVFPKSYLAALLAVYAGIFFVFSTSPSFRYGSGFVVSAALVVSVQMTGRPALLKPVFLLTLVGMTSWFAKNNWYHSWHFAKNAATRWFLPYPMQTPENSAYGYAFIDRKTKYYYPLSGDQCYDHCLPCAGHKLTGIHLRGTQVEQGFFQLPIEQ